MKKFRTQEDETKVESITKDEVTSHYNEVETFWAEVESLPNQSDFDLLGAAWVGIMFKYPRCCIAAFVNDLSKKETPAKRSLGNSGFIPCENHYQEYKIKADKLHELRVVYSPEFLLYVTEKFCDDRGIDIDKLLGTG